MQSHCVGNYMDTINSQLMSIQGIMRCNSSDKTLSLTGNPPRHSPIIIVGSKGSGKTCLLSKIIDYSCQWLNDYTSQVIKVIRNIGSNPSSSYASELLRNLCIHLTLVYGFEMRTDIVYELSSLSLWFQDLLKMIETTSSSGSTMDLVIILDDLHLLKFPQTTAILGWLPWSLPPSVHLICSVLDSDDCIVNILKNRIPCDNFIRLPLINSFSDLLSVIQHNLKQDTKSLTTHQFECLEECFSSIDLENNPTSPLYANLLSQTVLIKDNSQNILKSDSIPYDIDSVLNQLFDLCDQLFGTFLMQKIVTFISSTRYGLSEDEIIKLIANDVHNSADTWCAIRKQLKSIIKENFILERSFLFWKNSCICDFVKKRYSTDVETIKQIHLKLANDFYQIFTEVSEKFNFKVTISRNQQLNCFFAANHR